MTERDWTGRIPVHGVDYAFSNYTMDLAPAVWDGSRPIALRVAGSHPDVATDAVTRLSRQLTELTGLDIFPKEPVAKRVRVAELGSHEIVLQFLSTDDVARMAGPGVSGCDAYATLKAGRSGYDRACAWIVLDRDTDVQSLPLRIRHAAGHALGLDHAITTMELMSLAPDPDILDYGVGDQYALGQIGGRYEH